MKVHLPNSAFIGNIDPFLRDCDFSDRSQLKITSNRQWISVHPMVLSMITALGLTLDPKNIHCEKFEARSKNYFARMGLFNFLRIPFDGAFTEHEPAGRFIPLTQIKTSSELSRFITDMIPLLHLESEPAQTIGYIVSELVRNVIEHASAPNGALLCAQYYPKSNAIRIGIADTGVGIPTTIRQSHDVQNDLEALQLALWPGITGTTRKEGGTEQNAGAGLFFTKSIASVNRDFFFIYSGDSFYKLLKRPASSRVRLNANPFEDRHSKADGLPPWLGTVVGIDLTLDQTEEFSLLLDLIRKTYTHAVRDRVKARLKKARFI